MTHSNLFLIGFVLGLSALASGCKVGPDYQGAPKACVPDHFRELSAQNIFQSEAELDYWWTAFEDPALNTLIRRSAASNLDLRQAAMRIFEARAQRCTVKADLYPQISQDASYTLSRISRSGGFAGGGVGGGGGVFNGSGSVNEQWNIGLDGTWEVDVFGRLRRLVEAANRDIEVTVEDYRDTLVILLADVATNYVDARAFQQRIQIARNNLRTQERTLELTQIRFRAGLVSELDVAQALANKEGTAASIPSLEVSYQRALNRLSVLLGCPPGEVDSILANPRPIPSPPQTILVGIPADLLRRRPDIRRAEMRVAAQTARIGAAMGEMYPRFTILGSFGLSAQDFGKLFSSNAIGASIGPQMQWNILNFGQLRCNVYVQEAQERELEFAYQQSVLVAAEEVDNALVSYSQESRRLSHLRNQVAANQRAVDLAQERYGTGKTDFQRVLDSQRTLLNAQDAVATSEANLAASFIELYRALGGGWQRPVVEAPTVTPAPIPAQEIEPQ